MNKRKKVNQDRKRKAQAAANRNLKLEIATSDDESDVADYANYVPPVAPNDKWVRPEYDYWSANYLLNANTSNTPVTSHQFSQLEVLAKYGPKNKTKKRWAFKANISHLAALANLWCRRSCLDSLGISRLEVCNIWHFRHYQ
jgi:hypothetical protein